MKIDTKNRRDFLATLFIRQYFLLFHFSYHIMALERLKFFNTTLYFFYVIYFGIRSCIINTSRCVQTQLPLYVGFRMYVTGSLWSGQFYLLTLILIKYRIFKSIINLNRENELKNRLTIQIEMSGTIQISLPSGNNRISSMIRAPFSKKTSTSDTSSAYYINWSTFAIKFIKTTMTSSVYSFINFIKFNAT